VEIIMRFGTLFTSLSVVAFFAACSTDTPTAPESVPSLHRSSHGDAVVGGVYTMTNATTGNAVIAFARHADGTLTPLGSFPTGGAGTGGAIDPLSSQFSLELDPGHRILFVVNAGSDEISTFRVKRDGLELVDKASSGGDQPVSLTLHGRRLFVLNQNSDNIAGFRVRRNGELEPVPEWTRRLSGVATRAPEIRFTPDGRFLVISLRALGRIDVFPIERNGSPAAAPITSPSSGPGPFGFDFTQQGFAIVSEELSRPPVGAMSSYDVERNGTLSVITPSSPTSGPGACWVAITKDNRFAFVTNTGGGTISSFNIDSRGRLTPAELVAATTGPGSAPIDEDFSRDSRYLYVLLGGRGTIAAYAADDGGLTLIEEEPATPPASGEQGLAAW
jgi:6-phosphogluconolactonase